MKKAIYQHGSCAVGNVIYLVGGWICDKLYHDRVPNESIHFFDMSSSRKWQSYYIEGGCKRLDPVVSQIGPKTILISGGSTPKYKHLLYTDSLGK